MSVFHWLEHRREARALQRHAIPDPLWHSTLLRYRFLRRPPAEEAALRRLTTLFLAYKEFNPVGGLHLTDAMAVAVAAQACLPALHLGLGIYDSFVGVVLHADEVSARREIQDEHGLVHEYEEPLIGEAMEGGPVMLSWRAVLDADLSAAVAMNVVIHEFVHVIDQADGVCDGAPPLPSRTAKEHWFGVIKPAYEQFCVRVAATEAGHTSASILDPYGAESLEEFFPVAAEAFFTSPRELAAEYPALYELFANYFKQRP